ncbi:MAG: CYTH domain-containing protein [Chloroflexota bacterium]
MEATLEVELKLRAETDAPLRALAQATRLGPADLGPPSEVVELDRYLDTADGHLAAAGWACRLRTRRGSARLSLKGPPQHAAGALLHRRPEIEGPADFDVKPDRWPSSPARERLVELSGGADLVERLALRQRRVERAASVDGRRVGTLSLDSVQVEQEGVERGTFLAVELELDDAALDGGFNPALVVGALLATHGLVAEPQTKLERALALLDSGAA